MMQDFSQEFELESLQENLEIQWELVSTSTDKSDTATDKSDTATIHTVLVPSATAATTTGTTDEVNDSNKKFTEMVHEGSTVFSSSSHGSVWMAADHDGQYTNETLLVFIVSIFVPIVIISLMFFFFNMINPLSRCHEPQVVVVDPLYYHSAPSVEAHGLMDAADKGHQWNFFESTGKHLDFYLSLFAANIDKSLDRFNWTLVGEQISLAKDVSMSKMKDGVDAFFDHAKSQISTLQYLNNLFFGPNKQRDPCLDHQTHRLYGSRLYVILCQRWNEIWNSNRAAEEPSLTLYEIFARFKPWNF